ncbi:MAG: DUF3391 domain-containing protein [Nitrospira sp.]
MNSSISWLTTPFFRHKMTITSPQQIAQLKASGVQSLIVSFDADLVDEQNQSRTSPCTLHYR